MSLLNVTVRRTLLRPHLIWARYASEKRQYAQSQEETISSAQGPGAYHSPTELNTNDLVQDECLNKARLSEIEMEPIPQVRQQMLFSHKHLPDLASEGTKPAKLHKLYLAENQAEPTARRQRKRKAGASTRAPPLTLDPNAQNVLDEHLAGVHAHSREPGLEDLEQQRPASLPAYQEFTSMSYLRRYNALTERLCYMFSKDQIKAFASQLNLGRQYWSKHRLVREIVTEHWGWPDPDYARRAMSERTEVYTRDVPMSLAEIFVVMGKDGRDLQDIQARFKVHVSLIPEPPTLRGEGLKSALDAFEGHLASLKKSMVKGELQILSQRGGVPGELRESLSRQAGAHLSYQSTISEGQSSTIQLLAKSAEVLESAKRLVARSLHEYERNSKIRFLAYVPYEPPPANSVVPNTNDRPRYAVFPFLAPQQLPWPIPSGVAYRVRRVRNYLAGDRLESIAMTGGLAGEEGLMLNVKGAPSQLLQQLLREEDLDELSITATFGHLLWNPSKTEKEKSLLGPHPGHHSVANILNWIHGTEFNSAPSPSFVASLPTPVLRSTPAAHIVRLHLRYDAMEISGRDYAVDPWRRFVTLQVDLSNAAISPTSFGSSLNTIIPLASSDVTLNLKTMSRYYMGSDNIVALMMPDRPMDALFIAHKKESVDALDTPVVLQNYLENLEKYLVGEGGNKQPDAPLEVRSRDGQRFSLSSCVTVRESTETLGALNGMACSPPLEVKTKTMMDIETQEKTSVCELSLQGRDWSTFWKNCDHLSTSDSWSLTGATFLP